MKETGYLEFPAAPFSCARDHRDARFPFLLQAFPSIARLTPGKSLQARDDEVMPSVLDDGCGGFSDGRC